MYVNIYIYKYIHTYIYIYIRRHLDRGATRLRRIGTRLHPPSSVSFNLASWYLHPSYPSVLHPCIYILICLYPVGCILYPVV